MMIRSDHIVSTSLNLSIFFLDLILSWPILKDKETFPFEKLLSFVHNV